MDRKEIGAELFFDSYNCCQAVCGAFADKLSVSKEDLLMMSAPFGGGIARTRSVCGAVSGMCMVIGLLFAKVEGDNNANNGEIYNITKKALDIFEEKNGDLDCGSLLKNISNLTSNGNPEKRTKEYYAKRPCVKLIFDAIEIIEELIEE